VIYTAKHEKRIKYNLKGRCVLTKSSETRDRIISAAVDVLQSETVAGARIDRVAAAAGVARKTFYLHFKTKDDLLAAVVEQQRPHYIARFRHFASFAGDDASPGERVCAILRVIAMAAQSPEWKGCCYMRLAAELAHYPGHPVRLMVAEANEAVAEWLTQYHVPPHLPNARQIGRQLALIMNGMVMTQMIMHDNEVVSLAERLVTMLLPDEGSYALAA
jgi:AcrR family transcriptional regulator